jgi:hypothetical protein
MKTIILSDPIDIGGTQTRSLTMRVPSVGDVLNTIENLRRGNQMPHKGELMVIAKLCNTAYEDLLQIKFKDYYKLREAFFTLVDADNMWAGKEGNLTFLPKAFSGASIK